METLQTHFAKSHNLRRSIMRRIWYAYAMSLILRPALVLGVLFGASAIAFWRLASISSIATNFLSVEIGNMPQYIARSMTEADVMTLICFLVLSTVTVLVVGRLMGSLLAYQSLRYRW